MIGYIKSHSNYRLQEKHQLVNNGTILERDISTVGGANNFATGAATVYQSGNFVMVVNNGMPASRHIKKKPWLMSGYNSELWDVSALTQHSSDIYGSVERKIMLKNDFMDLRSFAYYGSLSSLIENSVNKILITYPYELYVGPDTPSMKNDKYFYMLPESYVNYFEIDNPGYVDIHSVSQYDNTDSWALKHFYNGGYNNYELILDDSIGGNDIQWSADTISSYVCKLSGGTTVNCVTIGDKLEIDNIDWYVGNVVISNGTNLFLECSESGVHTIPDRLANIQKTRHISLSGHLESDILSLVGSINNKQDFYVDNQSGTTASSSKKYYGTLNKTESIEITIDKYPTYIIIIGKNSFGEELFNVTSYNLSQDNTFTYDGNVSGVNQKISYTSAKELNAKCRGLCFTKININGNEIYGCWDNELNERYFIKCDDTNSTVNDSGERVLSNAIHIRPKSNLGFYDDFVYDLDLFGKCLVGEYSGRKNVANFEVLSDGDKKMKRSVETFIFPTGRGGYNLSSGGLALEEYVKKLGRIGVFYDNIYTDNLYRMMTHESLKNLDWTRGFNGNDGDGENVYIDNGAKFASVIKLMGYFFDVEKSYIDSIGSVNTITYSNRDNLSDYFLTDSLETDGWVVNTIYPYDLNEYDSNGTNVTNNSTTWCPDTQIANAYKRQFTENTAEIIRPYANPSNPHYMSCDCQNDAPCKVPINNYSGQTYYVKGGQTLTILKDYQENSETSIPQINNEFMKRLRINSKQILRKKGTIESIESMLSLFGLKSKRWCESAKYSYSGCSQFNFDIKEYTSFAPPITDVWDEQHKMYRIDWYNSCKTIAYPTQSFLNGEYIPYQGLPVAYKEVDLVGEKIRKLYPNFSSNGIYDGGMYYQMNGGWMSYMPYRFDNSDNMLNSDELNRTFTETVRNVLFVNNMEELVSQSIGDLYEGVVFYVLDTSDVFALINGYPYKLKTTVVNGNNEYYFDTQIQSSSLSIGGDLYEGVITVSDPTGMDGVKQYDLSLYGNGINVRVYYTGDVDNPFFIQGGLDGSYVAPESTYIFSGGCYDAEYDVSSHYFILYDVNNSDKIGPYYWEQIKTTDYIYQVIDDVIDKYQGNNPHNGNNMYDNGEEYLNRFRYLFEFPYENGYFNESCFPDVDSAYEEISQYGFNVKDYFGFGLQEKRKICHEFSVTSSGITCGVVSDFYHQPPKTIIDNGYTSQNKYIYIPDAPSDLGVIIYNPATSSTATRADYTNYKNLWSINPTGAFGISLSSSTAGSGYFINDIMVLSDDDLGPGVGKVTLCYYRKQTKNDSKVHAFIDKYDKNSTGEPTIEIIGNNQVQWTTRKYFHYDNGNITTDSENGNKVAKIDISDYTHITFNCSISGGNQNQKCSYFIRDDNENIIEIGDVASAMSNTIYSIDVPKCGKYLHVSVMTGTANTFSMSAETTDIKMYSDCYKSCISDINEYNFVSEITSADGSTSQIINTKRVKIIFYVDRLYSKEGQEYIKYIQSKVMPYVEQMIPSTLIVTVEFVSRYDEDESGCMINNNEGGQTVNDNSPGEGGQEQEQSSPNNSPGGDESGPNSSPSPNGDESNTSVPVSTPNEESVSPSVTPSPVIETPSPASSPSITPSPVSSPEEPTSSPSIEVATPVQSTPAEPIETPSPAQEPTPSPSESVPDVSPSTPDEN